MSRYLSIVESRRVEARCPSRDGGCTRVTVRPRVDPRMNPGASLRTRRGRAEARPPCRVTRLFFQTPFHRPASIRVGGRARAPHGASPGSAVGGRPEPPEASPGPGRALAPALLLGGDPNRTGQAPAPLLGGDPNRPRQAPGLGGRWLRLCCWGATRTARGKPRAWAGAGSAPPNSSLAHVYETAYNQHKPRTAVARRRDELPLLPFAPRGRCDKPRHVRTEDRAPRSLPSPRCRITMRCRRRRSGDVPCYQTSDTCHV